MKLSEIEILKLLAEKKEITIKELTHFLQKQKSFISSTISTMLKKQLIEITRKGKLKLVRSRDPLLADIVRKVEEKYPGLLKGKREEVLKSLFTPRSFYDILKSANISTKRLREILEDFKARGIVKEKNGTFSIVDEDVLLLSRLLSLTTRPKLFTSELKLNFPLTGFSLYNRFGIPVMTSKYYYKRDRSSPTIEEVFIHSLYFARDRREKTLVVVFYLKNRNRMDFLKAYLLAKELGIHKKLIQLISFINQNIDEIEEVAKTYGVELTYTTRDKLETLFNMIDATLDVKIEIYIIGGVNLVLRNLKISTKDVDVICEKKFYKKLKTALTSLGFSNRGIRWEKNSFTLDVFVNSVFSGYMLTQSVKKRSELFMHGNNLRVFLAPLEFVFLLKSAALREIDIDDCKRLAMTGLDWKFLFSEAIKQQEKIEKVLLLPLMDVIDYLKSQGFHINVPRTVERMLLKKMILYLLEKPLTVKELVKKLEKPESTVRKVLKELEKERKIKKVKKGKGFVFVKLLSS